MPQPSPPSPPTHTHTHTHADHPTPPDPTQSLTIAHPHPQSCICVRRHIRLDTAAASASGKKKVSQQLASALESGVVKVLQEAISTGVRHLWSKSTRSQEKWQLYISEMALLERDPGESEGLQQQVRHTDFPLTHEERLPRGEFYKSLEAKADEANGSLLLTCILTLDECDSLTIFGRASEQKNVNLTSLAPLLELHH